MPLSFGRRLLDTPAVDALALERAAGATASFEQLDALLRRSLAGERVLVVERTRARGTTAEFPGLVPDLSAWMHVHLSLDAVQKAGFWSTPQKGSVVAGPASTAWSLRERGRFGPQVSADERGRLVLDSPEAIAAWSLAVPALDSVYQPVYLRTTQAGTGDRPAQLAAWQGVADTLAALGVPSLDAFEAIRYGGGWSRLGVEERHEALVRYTTALHDALPDDAGSRLRLWLERPLVERYYGRAKADGTALMARVVTAAFRPALVGLWGGDWTAFVAYLGERLHPAGARRDGHPARRPHGTSDPRPRSRRLRDRRGARRRRGGRRSRLRDDGRARPTRPLRRAPPLLADLRRRARAADTEDAVAVGTGRLGVARASAQ